MELRDIILCGAAVVLVFIAVVIWIELDLIMKKLMEMQGYLKPDAEYRPYTAKGVTAYARKVDADTFVRSGLGDFKVKKGEWIIKRHDHEAFVMSDDEFKAKYCLAIEEE